jgi:hypothetical protein
MCLAVLKFLHIDSCENADGFLELLDVNMPKNKRF